MTTLTREGIVRMLEASPESAANAMFHAALTGAAAMYHPRAAVEHALDCMIAYMEIDQRARDQLNPPQPSGIGR